MPAKWSFKRKEQAAAAIQARWNKTNGTNKVKNSMLFNYMMYFRTRQGGVSNILTVGRSVTAVKVKVNGQSYSIKGPTKISAVKTHYKIKTHNET